MSVKQILLFIFLFVVIVNRENVVDSIESNAPELKIDIRNRLKKCYSDDSIECNILGNLYYFGDSSMGIRQDFRMAIRFYLMACRLKNINACVRAGEMYYNSKGVLRNLKKACDLGYSMCDGYLGE